jgi:hypothetical protein
MRAAGAVDDAVQAELSSRNDLQGLCFPSAHDCPSGEEASLPMGATGHGTAEGWSHQSS